MKEEKMYKILDKNGYSCNGGNIEWFLPKNQKDGSWKPGKWMPRIQGKLIVCENGYHLCREKDLLSWLNESIYEAEYKGKIIESNDKIVVRQARLVRKCENWDERTARLFACWCVRNTPLEDGRTVWDLLTDDRSRNAVKIAEQFANGKATKEELAAARPALWDAARPAAWAAARDAARPAAWAAARDAAWHAARPALWDAARPAAWAAQTKELLRILNEVRK